MTTIRVMAWPIRAKLTAHGEKRLLAKASRYHSASCVATSINAHQPNLRASNSSGLPPRHHVGAQLQQFAMTTILVMAWPVRTELAAHATRATPGKSLSASDCEPLSVSANTHRPSLRASNSSELHPCLHIGQRKVADYYPFSSIYVRLNLCTPSLERAPWPLALNIDTQDRCPLFRRMFCGHNIEFSCPAASKPHYLELPDCIHRSERPLRGQLQRFVMFIAYLPFDSPLIFRRI